MGRDMTTEVDEVDWIDYEEMNGGRRSMSKRGRVKVRGRRISWVEVYDSP